MIENLKEIIKVIDAKSLVELYKIFKIRYFELYIDDNKNASKYYDLCIAIRKELCRKGIWK